MNVFYIDYQCLTPPSQTLFRLLPPEISQQLSQTFLTSHMTHSWIIWLRECVWDYIGLIVWRIYLGLSGVKVPQCTWVSRHLFFACVCTFLQVMNGLMQTTGWPAVVACVGNWFGKGKWVLHRHFSLLAVSLVRPGSDSRQTEKQWTRHTGNRLNSLYLHTLNKCLNLIRVFRALLFWVFQHQKSVDCLSEIVFSLY